MPRLNVDWDAIAEEYVTSEISVADLAKRHGISIWTVNYHCQHSGWVAARRVRKVAAERALNEPSADEVGPMAEKSKKLRQGVADELLRDLAVVQKTPPAKLSDASRRQQILKTITDNGAVIHAWSERATEPAVRINLLATTAVVSVEEFRKTHPELAPPPATVIDVPEPDHE